MNPQHRQKIFYFTLLVRETPSATIGYGIKGTIVVSQCMISTNKSKTVQFSFLVRSTVVRPSITVSVGRKGKLERREVLVEGVGYMEEKR